MYDTLKITENGDQHRPPFMLPHPLCLELVIAAKAVRAACFAKDIQSFAAFQRFCAEHLREWPGDPTMGLKSADAKDEWNRIIRAAFERGKK